MSWSRGLLLGLLAIGLGPSSPAQAQFGPAATPAPGSFAAAVGEAVPAEGDWAEVMTVKDQWLVLKNAKGQQFPIQLGGVNLFVIRWPTRLEDVPRDALLEIYGLDLGTNQMQAEHVDVYERDTALSVHLVPTYDSLAKLGMLANNYQIQTNLQFNLFQPYFGVGSGPVVANGQPSWMHVVGSIVNANPLQVMTPGFVGVTVLPQGANGLTATLVTPGTSSLVRKGDLAYFIPAAATPKSLNLSQLVIYKKAGGP